MIARLLTPTGSDITPVFLANQQNDTTDIPFYAIVNFLAGTKHGTSLGFHDEIESASSIYQNTYTITVIGNNAIIWINRLEASLHLQSVRLELRGLGCGLLNVSAIRNLSLAIDGGYEERAQIEITLSEKASVRVSQNQINDVDFSMEIER